MEPPPVVQAELLNGSDIANGLPQVLAAAVLHQICLETRASSRLAWAVVRSPTRCLTEGPHLERLRRLRPISQGLIQCPERDRLLQHPARWGNGLHLQRCTSGLSPNCPCLDLAQLRPRLFVSCKNQISEYISRYFKYYKKT